ncbi:MAG TPA: hypothetical protein VG759_07915 [Candidatus Angelobacter sp.]|jgi:hypothetical protein|nr:hypothetical protein [Candidatus Angelobacter sp.]
MKTTSVPSTWRVSILTGEVFGGHCDYCNTVLSAEAISQNLFEAHSGHIIAVSASVRILGPEEYRGLELKFRAEWFVGRDRQFLDAPVHLPCVVFKLYCDFCLTQQFPGTESDVTAFRTQHCRHIEAVRIHAVLHSFVGRAMQQTILVIGQQDPYSHNVAQTIPPSTFALSRADQLLELARPLHGMLTAVRCNACKSRHLIKDHSEAAHELAQHRCHWDSVHVHVMLDKPSELAGRELEVPAFPFSLSSFVSSDGITIDCLLVKLFRQHGGASITPSNTADVQRYIQSPKGRHNQPRFRALVRGQGRHVFQCDFHVIHVHAPSRSFKKISRFQLEQA